MKIHLTLLLALTFFCCKAQLKTASADSLIIDFYPSFIPASKLFITRTNKLTEVHLQLKSPDTNGGYANHVNKLPQNASDSLWNYLKTYSFKIKNSTDTIGSYKTLDENGDSTIVYKIVSGLDGVDVHGVFKSDGHRKFAFWSPKQGTGNNNLMILIFDLMNNAFKNENYIKLLNNYFPLNKAPK